MNKVVIVPKTKIGLSRADIQHHLLNVHGPLAMAHEEVGGRFDGYAHAYAIDGASDSVSGAPLLDCDALSLVRIASKQVAFATLDNDAYRNHVQPDEDNFGDREGTRILFADATEWGPPAKSGDTKVILFRRAERTPPATALAEWRTRLERLLSRYPSVSYCHNAIEQGEEPAAWDAIDEVVVPSGGLPQDFSAQLSEAAIEVFGTDAVAAMVTRYQLFK
ncbi:hypothetical protein L288_14520 [Sphingobium quisquiliarum P25]|uniref:EthD domain-containing protein n=1 Tax=Sphingobium quisquiliarum P25 TaxID=1329909 RepID=T0HWY3_9SPHN|nr:EthD domain-containing protein [Sphingobium quisquiliarum]EQB03810.1 hypothetical protein L288_14520 [Sphingobium quisquiliarum P25]